ncbi:MAG: protein-L-isoaspartate(D-aspartate) O-methyltransferase [Actinomycetota bacterium]|nr:protein-L-isoaspartate(D-aspartate) O-methyltransferase [Actinomycetota bacterium]
MHDDWTHARREMLERLRGRGITDERVLGAMGTVPRERFVATELADQAYAERALPIAAGQTISAPGIVALMAAALELTGSERVLEVGSGSGYAAAVLSRCAGEVVAVELRDELVDSARATLAALDYHDVDVRPGDGWRGVPERAPYHAISVAAMAATLPAALIDQLATGGTLVCPVGGSDGRGQLIRYRDGRAVAVAPVGFVPLQAAIDVDGSTRAPTHNRG